MLGFLRQPGSANGTRHPRAGADRVPAPALCARGRVCARSLLAGLRRSMRLPALALLLLAVLANPVLAAIGDMHEASRGSGAHLHGAEAHASVDDPAPGEDDTAGDLLHALMHGAHCCGHLTALPSAFALAAATRLRPEPPRTAHLQHPSARVSTTIRPPIAA